MVEHTFGGVWLHNTFDCLDQRRNSFTFLRFAFAVLVLCSHSYSLGGFGKDPLYIFSNGQCSHGSVAVDSFFIISGFLVTQSCLNTSSIWRYLWHRILRVWPGYWICLLVTALIFGAIIHYYQHSNCDYFRTFPNNPLTYIKGNLLLMTRQSSIGNLLATNPYPNEFNGSLWVLPYLFLSYLVLGAFHLLGLLKKHKPILVSICLCLWVGNIFEQHMIRIGMVLLPEGISVKVPHLLICFLFGSMFLLGKKRIPLHSSIAIAATILTLLSWKYGFYEAVSPVVLPYIIIWLAIKLPLKHWDKWGDYSYGIYIYAFPVQQMMWVFGLYKCGIVVFTLVSLVFTLVIAIVSWWLIEKPCLGLKGISVRCLLQRRGTRWQVGRSNERGIYKSVMFIKRNE